MRWRGALRKMTGAKRGQPLITTDGLVVRAFNGVGEADRFITVLTRDRGLLRAAARGAQRIKSKNGPATQLLCYSRFRLIPGRELYIVEDARPIEVFFELRSDIEKTALAQYFCELATALCAADEPQEEALRLLLNALHLLGTGARDPLLLKATVEWRLLSLAGYMPDVAACAVCGKTDGGMGFSAVDGRIFCADCRRDGALLPLPAGAVAAVRYVVSCDLARLFSFALPPETAAAFAAAAEQFLKAQLQRSFKTLDFYHELGGTAP